MEAYWSNPEALTRIATVYMQDIGAWLRSLNASLTAPLAGRQRRGHVGLCTLQRIAADLDSIIVAETGPAPSREQPPYVQGGGNADRKPYRLTLGW